MVGGGTAAVRRRGGGRLRPTLFIHQRCGRLIETLPALQHDPNRPEDVLKVDADEDGVGGDDAADCAAVPGGDEVADGGAAEVEGAVIGQKRGVTRWRREDDSRSAVRRCRDVAGSVRWDRTFLQRRSPRPPPWRLVTRAASCLYRQAQPPGMEGASMWGGWAATPPN